MPTTLIIPAVALWMGTMLFAGLLSIYPKSVKVVRPLICPPGTKMEVRTFAASYHRPGERGIEVYTVGPEGQKSVKGRALLILWGLCCLVSALPSAIIVILGMRWIASLSL